MSLKTARSWALVVMGIPTLVSCTGWNASVASRSGSVFESAELVVVPDKIDFRIGLSDKELMRFGCHLSTSDAATIEHLARLVTSNKRAERAYPFPHLSTATGIVFRRNGNVVEQYFFSREGDGGELWGKYYGKDNAALYAKFDASLHVAIMSEVKTGKYSIVKNANTEYCNF